MALTGDRYVGEYAGHQLELVRDNLVKRLELLVDGEKVASESCALPHNITMTASLDHDGVRHTVTASSKVKFPSTVDTIEVDGTPLALTRAK